MKQSIVTKYLGPTNTLGSRISVRAQAGSRRIDWDENLGVDENHERAAMWYAETMGWSGLLYGGAMPDGTGYCFVFVDVDSLFEVADIYNKAVKKPYTSDQEEWTDAR